METLRDRMEADLKIGCYSASTRKIYLLYARLFAKHHMRSPMRAARETGKPLSVNHFAALSRPAESSRARRLRYRT